MMDGRSSRFPFHVLAKPIGPICNLDCRYCFYLEKERLYPGNTAWAMSDEVLESFVRQYIRCQESDVIHFAWQGGEPTLLGVDFFRRVIDLQQKYGGARRIENSLQTNGVALNDAWGEFLASRGFLVGLSLDGPEELHDRYRVRHSGRPTFRKVMKGLEVLKKHGVEFNILTAVHNVNVAHPVRIYRFLKETGCRFFQLIPLVGLTARVPNREGLVLAKPGVAGEPTAWSVNAVEYGEFLCSIFDEWVRKDVGSYFVQMFDVALESWLGREPSLCIFKKNCGQALALEHNGDLYSCDHYVFADNRLGNLRDRPLRVLANSDRQSAFGLAKSAALPVSCVQCDVLFACRGECPKNRLGVTSDGEAGLNYLCAGYKRFFRHIDPFMRFMANELRNGRPPANVMTWIQRRRSEALTPGGRRRVSQGSRGSPCENLSS